MAGEGTRRDRMSRGLYEEPTLLPLPPYGGGGLGRGRQSRQFEGLDPLAPSSPYFDLAAMIFSKSE